MQFGCVLSSEHLGDFLLLLLLLLLLLIGLLFLASVQLLIDKLWEDVLNYFLVELDLGIGSIGEVKIKLVLMVA